MLIYGIQQYTKHLLLCDDEKCTGSKMYNKSKRQDEKYRTS